MPISLDNASYVLFVCEGTFEEVAVKILCDANVRVIPSTQVVGITRLRKAALVQDAYLNIDYDWPLTIVRIVDSRKEQFKLGNLYRDRYQVINAYTRPEAEMLTIIREGRFADYSKYKNKMKPSDYCKQVLGMNRVKSESFLKGYWDAVTLAKAAHEYKRLHRFDKHENCLADLLK